MLSAFDGKVVVVVVVVWGRGWWWRVEGLVMGVKMVKRGVGDAGVGG